MDMLLDVVKLTKEYPGVRALDGLDFDLKEGEIQCLVGQNGAGKSTLIELLAGSIRPTSGEIWVSGRSYAFLTPNRSIGLGIQTIHQEDQLIEELSVAENIFLRSLKTGAIRLFSFRKCVEESVRLLASLGISVAPRAKVASLSPVDRKSVCVARAFSEKARILTLDEPTASLDKVGKETLFAILRKIVRTGIGVIYISHNLDEVFEVGDRITILKDGKKISTYVRAEVQEAQVIADMIGRSTSSFFQRQATSPGDRVLEVKGYSRKPVVYDVCFQVRSGEIFGIGGMVGSGRTELARLIFGLDKRDSGNLVFCGKDITPNSPHEALGRGIGLLTEDRKKTGLIMARPIYENVSVAKIIKERAQLLNLPRERREVGELSRKLNIVASSINQLVVNLSGGNQQKVVVAKWLFANSEVIIFDEPTLGVDVGAKAEIYRLMGELLKDGKIVIMISSDNIELVAMSDRVGIMRDGRMTIILEGTEKTQENILKHSIGALNG
jgi:ribose transport system ATP-binding protein